VNATEPPDGGPTIPGRPAENHSHSSVRRAGTGNLVGEFYRRREDVLGGTWLSTDPVAAARQLRAEMGPTGARQWAADLLSALSTR